MVKILAKSYSLGEKEITLQKHTDDVMKAFERLSQRMNLEGQLKEAVKVAIFLHDLGKVLPCFQIKYLGNRDYRPWDVVHEIPHSLFSIFWTDENNLKKVFGEDYANYILSSVAYHHWKDSFVKFISTREESLIRLCEKLKRDWEEPLMKNLLEEFSNSKEYAKFISSNQKLIEGIINRRTLDRFVKTPYLFDYEPSRGEVRKDWILVAGLLQRCDHFASWSETEEREPTEVEIEPKDKDEIRKGVEKNIGSNAWQFTKLDLSDKNVILIAPTGYGKTEFAFLWSNGEKFIYTLPIRAAVNQIFERAKKLFGGEKTGLLHSDADVYLLKKAPDDVDTIKTYECSRLLSYPVIISTGDQFFPYALRPPGYEKIFATLSYSRLVIDEVQAYDPKACAIIVKFIEWIHKLGGKLLLMTATLPEFVKEKIEKIIPKGEREIINIYEEEKEYLQRFFKHKIEIVSIEQPKLKEKNKPSQFELPEAELEKIISNAARGKRVLVVLNTVRFAQYVYHALKERLQKKNPSLRDNIFLLHSRFTFADRESKEDRLAEQFINPKPVDEKEGKILVATQVVEASLDIDADVLFTEICPFDALVQRMGRVLRRYHYVHGKVKDRSKDEIIKELNEDFKAFGEEPNVYVWVFEGDDKKGFESGMGRVYRNELLEFTCDLLKPDNGQANGTKHVEISEYQKYEINKSFYEKIQKPEKSIEHKTKEEKSKKSSKKSSKGESERSEYLKEYYEMLDILEAGFMSDRKSEAFRIFREIYTASAIPESKIDEFKKELEKYIKKDEIDYVSFKRDILSKFIVSIDARTYVKSDGTLGKSASYLMQEIECDDDKKRKRLSKWLEDVYICFGEYDPEIGFKSSEGQKSKDFDERAF